MPSNTSAGQLDYFVQMALSLIAYMATPVSIKDALDRRL
jgi:hypothetical protein